MNMNVNKLADIGKDSFSLGATQTYFDLKGISL